MNESSAREVLLIHAFETAELPSSSWNEADKARASRDTRVFETDKKSLDNFIALRAKCALHRLSKKAPEITKYLATGLWRWSLLSWALLLGLVLGAIANSIGSSQFINLLAPPIIFVVLWNIVLYICLLLHTIIARPQGDGKHPFLYPLIQCIFRNINSLLRPKGDKKHCLLDPFIQYILRHINFPQINIDNLQIIENFTEKWHSCSTQLIVARSTMLLHTVAVGLGLGLIAGFYARGLVFDYRAAWESTFLSANAAHGILRMVLTPAISLSGISFPDEAAFTAMRMVHGSNSTGVSGATWIHLYSLTLLIIVVIPRFVLMIWYGLKSFLLARNMKIPLDEAYIDLLSNQHKGYVPTSSIIIGLVANSNADKMAFLQTMLGSQDALLCESLIVKKFQCVFPLIETKEEQLQLWVTHNFKESERLVKRLRASGKLLKWKLGNLLDRLCNSEFLREQQVREKAMDDADVILYIINSTGIPDKANYVEHEMDLLSLIDRPVIVLVNQIDTSRESDINKDAEIQSWRVYLKKYDHVKSVMSLAELAHCWMSDDRLYSKVEDQLVDKRKILMKRLRLAMRSQQNDTLDSAAEYISCHISLLASHFEIVPDEPWAIKPIFGIGNDNKELIEAAHNELYDKLKNEVCENTSKLLDLHGYLPDKRGDIRSDIQMLDTYNIDRRSHVDEKKASVISVVLTGLVVDITTGGLTFGTGMISGVLGFLAAKAWAIPVNKFAFCADRPGVEWGNKALDQMMEDAFLRYLTVVHFVRGENGLIRDEWPTAIKASLDTHRKEIKNIWKLRDSTDSGNSKAKEQIAKRLQPIVKQSLCETLNMLYPDDTQIEFKSVPTK